MDQDGLKMENLNFYDNRAISFGGGLHIVVSRNIDI